MTRRHRRQIAAGTFALAAFYLAVIFGFYAIGGHYD